MHQVIRIFLRIQDREDIQEVKMMIASPIEAWFIVAGRRDLKPAPSENITRATPFFCFC
jgi:hypothetical protein